jgi:hypothetical protein
MPMNGRDDAVRRSSDEMTRDAPDVRQVIRDSLNERRLQRERIIASLLLCPGLEIRAQRGRV